MRHDTERLSSDDAPSRWWQHGVIYQVYPLSFADSNGDGSGDLRGIVARLGHLRWLGVDAVWISPIYPSPMADFGYDVSDYCDVDPRFGNLADFDALTTEAHRLGLRVILDFIPNHTSAQHPWFVESRSSRENAKRDWYLWRDPAPLGGPPNNWLAEFGGPAWQFDPATGQYYQHSFLKEQPDLNWRNPEVQEAMLEVMRFWLQRGVDGFRVDAIHHLFKDAQFRDNPPNPKFRPGMLPRRQLLRKYSTDLPEVQGAARAMRAALGADPDRVLIGEAYLPLPRLVAYYGDQLDGFHLPFNFHLIESRWDAAALAAMIAEYEACLPPGAWPNWVLGNHDRSRIQSRVGPAQARVAAVLLCTLRGTPTMYYGDELGMCDVPIAADQVRDPFEKNVPGMGLGRDPERTPMQWSPAAHAGFSTATPWLPLAADFQRVNVEVQSRDPASMLSLYRDLLALRRARQALSIGSYQALTVQAPLLGYVRAHGSERIAVLLNLSATPQPLLVPEVPPSARLLLSTHPQRTGGSLGPELLPDEAVLVPLPPD
ncbi:MAG TPA: alpha-amylase family glycosyl hydrolase [Polyangiaceae bacterium]|nr:alpha-amylase family glycosyl hydrolase [Polyangiaceae bacterium]